MIEMQVLRSAIRGVVQRSTSARCADICAELCAFASPDRRAPRHSRQEAARVDIVQDHPHQPEYPATIWNHDRIGILFIAGGRPASLHVFSELAPELIDPVADRVPSGCHSALCRQVVDLCDTKTNP